MRIDPHASTCTGLAENIFFFGILINSYSEEIFPQIFFFFFFKKKKKKKKKKTLVHLRGTKRSIFIWVIHSFQKISQQLFQFVGFYLLYVLIGK